MHDNATDAKHTEAPPDVAALMAEVKLRARALDGQAARVLAPLRAGGGDFPGAAPSPGGAGIQTPPEPPEGPGADSALATQDAANEIFAALTAPAPEEDVLWTAPFHDLVDDARTAIPDGPARRSGPVRRMIDRLRCALLAPQERFNLRLLGRLADVTAPLAPARRFDLSVAVTGRLVGSVNGLLRAQIRHERWLDETIRDGVAPLTAEMARQADGLRDAGTALEALRAGVESSLRRLLDSGYGTEMAATAAGHEEAARALEALAAKMAEAGAVMNHVREVAVAANEARNMAKTLSDRMEEFSGLIMADLGKAGATAVESRNLAVSLVARLDEVFGILNSDLRATAVTAGEARAGVDGQGARIAALTVRAKRAQEERDAVSMRLEALERTVEQMLAGGYASKAAAAGGGVRAAPAAVEHSRAADGASDGAPAPVTVGSADFDFLAWENLTRGSEASITDAQRRYVDIFRAPRAANVTGEVLDAGCGRGEFLDLLRDAGVPAYGLDLDMPMVEHCRAKGHRAEPGDLFDHLRGLPDGSLGGLFLAQVVEHIPPGQIHELTNLMFSKLAPGAPAVTETINPECLSIFSGAFYADPTHYKPVHPKALEFFLRASGFRDIGFVYSAEVPDADKLAALAEPEAISPVAKALVLQANRNFDRLNTLLYGYAHYAAVAIRT